MVHLLQALITLSTFRLLLLWSKNVKKLYALEYCQVKWYFFFFGLLTREWKYIKKGGVKSSLEVFFFSFHCRLEQPTGICHTSVHNSNLQNREMKEEATLQGKLHNSRSVSHVTIYEMPDSSFYWRNQILERACYFLGARQLISGVTSKSTFITIMLHSLCLV